MQQRQSEALRSFNNDQSVFVQFLLHNAAGITQVFFERRVVTRQNGRVDLSAQAPDQRRPGSGAGGANAVDQAFGLLGLLVLGGDDGGVATDDYPIRSKT